MQRQKNETIEFIGFRNQYCQYLLTYLERNQKKFNKTDKAIISELRNQFEAGSNMKNLPDEIADFIIAHLKVKHTDKTKSTVTLKSCIPKPEDDVLKLARKIQAIAEFTGDGKQLRSNNNSSEELEVTNETYKSLISLLKDPIWKPLTSKGVGIPKGFKKIIKEAKNASQDDTASLLQKIHEIASERGSESIPRLLGKKSTRNPVLVKVYKDISKASSIDQINQLLVEKIQDLKQQQKIDNRL